MWKLKFFWHFFLTLVDVIKRYDHRLWMRYRENGNSNRWKLEGRKYDVAFRKEKMGNPMTKAWAHQWELHQAFQSKDEELEENLTLSAVNLITWIALLKMDDEIETKEDRAEQETVGEE